MRPARLSLVTDPPSTVHFNGQVLGTTPLQAAYLPAGRHTLQLSGPDKHRYVLTLQLEAGVESQVKVRLAQLPSID